MQGRMNRAEVLRVNAWPAHVLQRTEREVSVFRHPIFKEFQTMAEHVQSALFVYCCMMVPFMRVLFLTLFP